MRSVPVSDFLPTLRQLVNVPLTPLMIDAIIQAAQTFCRESKVAIYPREFSQVYSCQTVNMIKDSALNRQSNNFKSAGILSVMAGGKTLDAGVDYRALSLDSIRFLVDAENVEIICAVEPVLKATSLPAMLFDDYLYPLCQGAASRLQMQPNTEWYNPALAAENRRDFTESYRDAYRFRIESGDYDPVPNPVRKREFF